MTRITTNDIVCRDFLLWSAARSQTGNLSTEDGVLYSYHTAIAKLHKVRADTPHQGFVVLIDARKYSNTTEGKHKHVLRSTIRAWNREHPDPSCRIETFDVPVIAPSDPVWSIQAPVQAPLASVSLPGHQANLLSLLSSYEATLDQLVRADPDLIAAAPTARLPYRAWTMPIVTLASRRLYRGKPYPVRVLDPETFRSVLRLPLDEALTPVTRYASLFGIAPCFGVSLELSVASVLERRFEAAERYQHPAAVRRRETRKARKLMWRLCNE